MSEEEALFCFASYLMAFGGDHAYFFYSSGYKMAAQRTWYTFYDADLGTPLADYAARDGGFWRPFARGAVVANPGSRPVVVSLPRRFVTLAGEEVEKVSLGSKQAAILLLPSAQEE